MGLGGGRERRRVNKDEEERKSFKLNQPLYTQ